MTDRHAEFVNILYTHLLLDPDLARWFHNADVDRIKSQQVSMTGLLLDSEKRARAKDGMRRSHKDLVDNGLSDKSYDAFLVHAREAAGEAHLEEDEIETILAAMEEMRDAILGR